MNYEDPEPFMFHSFTPTVGLAGEIVTVTGEKLDRVTSIRLTNPPEIDFTLESFNLIDNETITFEIPSELPLLTYEVFLVSDLPGEEFYEASGPDFLQIQMPAFRIDRMDPTSGKPGITVQLAGPGGYLYVNLVRMELKSDPEQFTDISEFNIVDHSTINFTVPNIPSDHYDVYIFYEIPGELPTNASAPQSFFVEPLYDFGSFSPLQGAPGQLMALEGVGFETLTRIIFTSLTDETVIVSDFQVQSDVRLTFTLPNMPSGAYELKLLWEIEGEDDVEIAHADTFIVPAPDFTFLSFSPEEGEPGTTVEILGTGLEYVEGVNFNDLNEVQTEIVSWDLTADNRTLQFILPEGLLPGEYDVSLDFVVPGVAAETITHRDPFTVLVPPDPILVSEFSPTTTLYQGGEEFQILGQGFEPANLIRVQFGNETLILGDGLTLVEPGQIRGRFPYFPNAPTSVIPDVIRSIDGELETVPAPEAVEVIGPLQITSVVQSPDPFPAGPGGGQDVTIEGIAFRDSCRVFIGGQEMINLALLPNGSLQGRAPDLAAGQYDLVVRDQATNGTNLFVEALNQVTYEAVPAPRVTRISPFFLTINGRTEIQIEGENFTPTTRIFFQGLGRNDPLVGVDFEFQSSSLLTAMAPVHSVGTVNAIAENTAGQTTLPEAAEYVSPFTPAPQQVYGTLVNHEVEFSWINPIQYEQIHMYRNGEFVVTLPGDTTQFVDPAQISESSAHYTMVGELIDGSCSLLSFDIMKLICDPPLDHGTADRGPKDFSILGTHDPYEPPEEGAGGGVALGFADSTISASNDVNHFPLVIQAARENRPKFNKFGSYNYLILRPNELVSGLLSLKNLQSSALNFMGLSLFPQ